jgi:hypothetical protein
LVSETLNGTCTAFIYTNDDEPDAAGRPVLYSDNGNTPLTRKSKNENLIDFRVSGGKPKGWRNGTFQTNGSISSGSYIWFGVFAEYWLYPRFDYGAKFYRDWWDDYTSIPDTYPLYDARNYNNLKLSMYFTYSAASPAQNHVRTLTQGVRLADNRKLAGAYKRSVTQTAYNSMALKSLPILIRSVLEQVRAGMGIFERRGLTRFVPESVQANSAAYRLQGFYRKAHESVRGTDYLSVPALLFCKLAERVRVWDTAGHWADYVRGLYFEAGNIAETSCGGAYYRTQTETVGAHGAVFRGLLLFVRLLTTSLVRDFLLRRFLKSNEEMVLKSGICREIVIDSGV